MANMIQAARAQVAQLTQAAYEKAAAQGDSYAANKLEILKKRSIGHLFS